MELGHFRSSFAKADVVNEKPEWKQIKIHHAVSGNGISGWSQDSSALFDRSDFSWTELEIRSPAAYFDGSKIKLWFAGHDKKNNLGIGSAVRAL